MNRLAETLEPRVRLFHIGPQKTGTTALQAVAAASREGLLLHGVHYPGETVNHRMEVAALVGKPVGWRTRPDGSPTPPPPRRLWDGLVAEIRADRENRIWFGHEYAAGATTAQILEVADTLGERLHVVVTLRSLARMLPSIWQETNKAAGNRGTFERWLERVFAEGTHVNQVIWARHDQGRLVRRWADVLGPDRVTVVIPDPADRGFLFHAFEDLLALPRDLLARSEPTQRAGNRSLTATEIELFRQFNKRFRAADTTWQQYDLLVVRGALSRVLGHRMPPPAEPRLTMPDWAADLADEAARSNAEAVAGAGVRLVGDPQWLALPAQRRESAGEDHRSVTEIPLELAVDAMLGLAAAALGRAPDLARAEPDMLRKTDLLGGYRAADLAEELWRRARRRASSTIGSLRREA